MGWYNGGNWEKPGGNHLPYIIRDLMRAINQRWAVVGSSLVDWIDGAADEHYPTPEEITEHLGAINSAAMVDMIAMLRDEIEDLIPLNSVTAFVTEESGDTIVDLDWIFDELEIEGWSPVEGDASFYGRNGHIWNQMRDALDRLIYVVAAAVPGANPSAITRASITSPFSTITECWDAAVAALAEEEDPVFTAPSIGGNAQASVFGDKTARVASSVTNTINLNYLSGGEITREQVGYSDSGYDAQSEGIAIDGPGGGIETHDGTLTYTPVAVSGFYTVGGETEYTLSWEPAEYLWEEPLPDFDLRAFSVALAGALLPDLNRSMVWLDISGELDDQA